MVQPMHQKSADVFHKLYGQSEKSARFYRVLYTSNDRNISARSKVMTQVDEVMEHRFHYGQGSSGVGTVQYCRTYASNFANPGEMYRKCVRDQARGRDNFVGSYYVKDVRASSFDLYRQGRNKCGYGWIDNGTTTHYFVTVNILGDDDCDAFIAEADRAFAKATKQYLRSYAPFE